MFMLLVGLITGMIIGIVLTGYRVVKAIDESGHKMVITNEHKGGYAVNIYPNEGD
jgi:hypothetical protein